MRHAVAIGPASLIRIPTMRNTILLRAAAAPASGAGRCLSGAGDAIARTRSQPITTCVVKSGGLRQVRAQYDSVRHDTTMKGLPLSKAFPRPAGYAAGEPWYRDDRWIVWEGRPYGKLGRPRLIASGGIERYGEYEGVTLSSASPRCACARSFAAVEASRPRGGPRP
jgi:hypothetical protein